MFTKRHEQELAEIKALIVEVGQSFQQVVERLERMQETQDQLAADQPAAAREPAASPAVVQVLDGAPESEAAATKKARRRQSRAAAGDTTTGPKSGKRGKAGATAKEAAGDAPEGGDSGKRRGGAKRRQPAELAPAEFAPSSGSDEE
jgi:hypothetical protein